MSALSLVLMGLEPPRGCFQQACRRYFLSLKEAVVQPQSGLKGFASTLGCICALLHTLIQAGIEEAPALYSQVSTEVTCKFTRMNEDENVIPLPPSSSPSWLRPLVWRSLSLSLPSPRPRHPRRWRSCSDVALNGPGAGALMFF